MVNNDPTQYPGRRRRRITVIAATAALAGAAIITTIVFTHWSSTSTSTWTAIAADRSSSTVSRPVSGSFRSETIHAGPADVVIGYDDIKAPRIDFDDGGSGMRFSEAITQGALTINVPADGQQGSFQSTRSPKLTVRLPKAMQAQELPVTVASSSGDITMDGSYGAVRLSTASGDMHLTGTTGDLTVQTSSGTVAARDLTVAGHLTSTTASGDTGFELRGMPSSMQVESASGDVVVGLPHGDHHINAETTSGTLQNAFPSHSTSSNDFQISSQSGDVTVEADAT